MRISALILLATVGYASADTTFTYTPQTMPAYWQSILRHNGTGSFFWPQVSHHGPDSEGFASNPNMQHPWLRPAGFNLVDGSKVTIRRTLTLPEGQHIHVWHEQRGTQPLLVNGRSVQTLRHVFTRWVYPVGTKVREMIYYDGRLCSDREREKASPDPDDPWDVTRAEQYFDPPGYVAESRDCFSCHKDAGKHVTQLEGDFPGRDWYGYARGGDQVFSFRPVLPNGTIHPDWRNEVVMGRPPVTQSGFS